MAAGVILEALDEIVAAIAAAGVKCTRDPDEMQPPAVIVGAPTILDATLGGVLELSVPIYAVTPDPGAGGLAQLLEMADGVRSAVGIVSATPQLWTSPQNPAGMPAYLMPLSIAVQAA